MSYLLRVVRPRSAEAQRGSKRRTVTRAVVLTVAVTLVSALPVTPPSAQAAGDSRAVSEGPDSAPWWTPDSSSVLFAHYDKGTLSLQRQRLNRTTSVTVQDSDNAWRPRMSPDGTRVAYTRSTENGSVVAVLTLATGQVEEVGAATGLRNSREASWSPDGTQLVFAGGNDWSTWRIYKANADGSGVVPLSDSADGNDLDPVWSPDGRTVAYSQFGSENEVKLVDADGSHERVLATNAFDATWSPDSSRLVITRGGIRYQLRVVRADGSVVEDLTSAYSDQQPSWSPDGNYLAFTRNINGTSRIWVRSFGPAIPAAVPPPPPSVSVNAGGIYTKSTQVTLHLTLPEGASTVTVANDGGFAPSKTFAASTRIPWTLVSSGADRLPKTVYVRFDGQGPAYTDDIILDQTNPGITSASVSTVNTSTVSTAGRAVAAPAGTMPTETRGGSSATVLRAGLVRTRTLRIRASDNRSGVRRLQYNRARSRVGAKTVRYRTPLVIRAWKTTYVRVRDGAGNWSRWRLAGIVRRTTAS